MFGQGQESIARGIVGDGWFGSMINLNAFVPQFGRRDMQNPPTSLTSAQTPFRFFPKVKIAFIDHAHLFNDRTAHQDAAAGDPINQVWRCELMLVRLILGQMDGIPVGAQTATG